jgi:hypothetical protein
MEELNRKDRKEKAHRAQIGTHSFGVLCISIAPLRLSFFYLLSLFSV